MKVYVPFTEDYYEEDRERGPIYLCRDKAYQWLVDRCNQRVIYALQLRLTGSDWFDINNLLFPNVPTKDAVDEYEVIE